MVASSVLWPGAHEIAHVHLPAPDAAGHGRVHRRVAQVQLRLGDGGAVGLDGRRGLVDRRPGGVRGGGRRLDRRLVRLDGGRGAARERLGLVKGLGRHELARGERPVALHLLARIGQVRLVAGELRLGLGEVGDGLGELRARLGVIGLVARELGHRLGERGEKRLLVDHEEELAFLHVGAVDELPLGEEALDPRPDVHGLHADEGAHELAVERHALLHGRRDLQRRRRRRRGLLLALARREQEEPGEHGDAPSAGRGEPGHFRSCSSLARSSRPFLSG